MAGQYYKGKKHGSSLDELGKVTQQLRDHNMNFDNAENITYVEALLQKQAAAATKVEFVYPKLDWDLLSLSNDIQYKNFLMNFDRLFPGQRKISDSTFYAASKLDPDTEREKLKREFKQSLDDKLEKAKVVKEYKQKFIDAGLQPPMDLELSKPPTPGVGTPGPGGMIVPPGGTPPIGSTGGGNLPGAPATVPNAPVGRNQFQGEIPRAPRSPEASRLESQKIHTHLTEAALEIDKENQEEILRLRKFNKEANIPIDQIDVEAKANAEFKEKKDSSKS